MRPRRRILGGLMSTCVPSVFNHPGDPLETYREAALLYFRCRRLGVTVRSTIDCLIARQAIEQDLLLIHNDRDFSNMADIVPELKLA